MEISNFEVVNEDRFSKIFKLKFSNFDFVTNSGNKSISNFKISSSYPTLFLNIERVICGSINSFTARS